MEEKILTDEQIVKAFKFCLKDKGACDKCKVYNKNKPMLSERFIVCKKLIKYAYDLIHRLQDENAKLKERNYWLESEHEYQCEKSYFEGVEKGEKKSAKEICEEYGYLLSKRAKNEIAKRYGVEVE